MVTQSQAAEPTHGGEGAALPEPTDRLEALLPVELESAPIPASRRPIRPAAKAVAGTAALVAAVWFVSSGGDSAPTSPSRAGAEPPPALAAPVPVEEPAPAPAPRDARRSAPVRLAAARAVPKTVTGQPALPAPVGALASTFAPARPAPSKADPAPVRPLADDAPATARRPAAPAPPAATHAAPPPPAAPQEQIVAAAPPPPAAVVDPAPVAERVDEDRGQPTENASGPPPLDMTPNDQTKKPDPEAEQQTDPPDMGAAGDDGYEDPDYVPDEPYVEGTPKG